MGLGWLQDSNFHGLDRTEDSIFYSDLSVLQHMQIYDPVPPILHQSDTLAPGEQPLQPIVRCWILAAPARSGLSLLHGVGHLYMEFLFLCPIVSTVGCQQKLLETFLIT